MANVLKGTFQSFTRKSPSRPPTKRAIPTDRKGGRRVTRDPSTARVLQMKMLIRERSTAAMRELYRIGRPPLDCGADPARGNGVSMNLDGEAHAWPGNDRQRWSRHRRGLPRTYFRPCDPQADPHHHDVCLGSRGPGARAANGTGSPG